MHHRRQGLQTLQCFRSGGVVIRKGGIVEPGRGQREWSWGRLLLFRSVVGLDINIRNRLLEVETEIGLGFTGGSGGWKFVDWSTTLGGPLGLNDPRLLRDQVKLNPVALDLAGQNLAVLGRDDPDLGCLG